MAEDTLNIHIFPTKLNPPEVDRRWVLRSRLILRLNEGLKKTADVHLGAGRLRQDDPLVKWMDQVRRNSAWLSLHKNDSDNVIPSDSANQAAQAACGRRPPAPAAFIGPAQPFPCATGIIPNPCYSSRMRTLNM